MDSMDLGCSGHPVVMSVEYLLNCFDDLKYLAFKMERRRLYLLASCQPCQGTKTRKCFTKDMKRK